MRASLRPLLPDETDWESLSVFMLIPSAIVGRLWLMVSLPLPPCMLKHYTGCPCPGCGATRAAHALFNGRTDEALRLNPLATVLAFATAIWCAYSLAMLVSSRRRWRIDGAHEATGTVIRILLVAALVLNWGWVALHLPESPWHEH